MDQEFSLLKTTRENIQKIVSSFSNEQLMTIPDNFKNNLFWNYGHIIVTQQLLCYKLAKVEMLVPDTIVEKYKKGTIASGEFSSDDFMVFNEQCIKNVQRMEEDYKNGLFKSFDRYETSYGFELT